MRRNPEKQLFSNFKHGLSRGPKLKEALLKYSPGAHSSHCGQSEALEWTIK
jgi:hypothetical protein